MWERGTTWCSHMNSMDLNFRQVRSLLSWSSWEGRGHNIYLRLFLRVRVYKTELVTGTLVDENAVYFKLCNKSERLLITARRIFFLHDTHYAKNCYQSHERSHLKCIRWKAMSAGEKEPIGQTSENLQIVRNLGRRRQREFMHSITSPRPEKLGRTLHLLIRHELLKTVHFEVRGSYENKQTMLSSLSISALQ